MCERPVWPGAFFQKYLQTKAIMSASTRTKWEIDPMHSEIQFKVKHLVISTVTGKFNSFEGSFEMEDQDLSTAEASFSIDIDSISTGVPDRDNHLKSDDFFNAEKYPKMTFRSTEVQKMDDDHYKLKGDLTIRDITKPVELEVEKGGIVQDPYGNTKAGFEVTGKINRKEFGLKWDAVTEAGSVVVGDEVRLELNVQFARP
jgi:polyisoprenoid-binding protein YceI